MLHALYGGSSNLNDVIGIDYFARFVECIIHTRIQINWMLEVIIVLHSLYSQSYTCRSFLLLTKKHNNVSTDVRSSYIFMNDLPVESCKMNVLMI